MMQEFTAPLAINQCKVGDTLVFSADETTPYDFTLTIANMAGTTVYGPIAADVTRDGVLYWHVVMSTANGFAAQTYYEATISDGVTADIGDATYIVYVNDDLTMENYIVRALGLAGHNMRRYSHTYTNGLLTSFRVRTYLTAAALDAAIAGTADNYNADYLVTITYNNSYNRITLTSVKQ